MEKILGIIAEYNPFHNGHLYHINKSKELVKPDYTVCIISGNFVQRGNVSIVDKWSKAEMALHAGVNLVIELPTLYSISSAENFAEGCIKILDSLNLDTVLSFSSECGDISILNMFVEILRKEPSEYKTLLSHELNSGLSYPKAREKALLMYVNDIRKYSNILSMPNNILGIEYLKAMNKLKSNILPITIKRCATAHDSHDVIDNYASSTHIRELLCANKSIYNLVPKFTYEILARQINSGRSVLDIVAFEREISYALRKMKFEDIKNLPDVTEGLANSLANAISSNNSYSKILDTVKSKTYTQTRIQRILLYALLDITKSDMEISRKVYPYIRVLGLDNKGKELLSIISKTNPKLPVVTSVKDFLTTSTNKSLNIMMNKDILATNIYTLEYLNDSYSNMDYTHKIVTLTTEKDYIK